MSLSALAVRAVANEERLDLLAGLVCDVTGHSGGNLHSPPRCHRVPHTEKCNKKINYNHIVQQHYQYSIIGNMSASNITATWKDENLLVPIFLKYNIQLQYDSIITWYDKQ